jgi:signal transduction histidine kinase
VNTADLARMARGLRQRAAQLLRPSGLLRRSRSLPTLVRSAWYLDAALALAAAVIAVRTVQDRHIGGTQVFPRPGGGLVLIPVDPGTSAREFLLAVLASAPLALRRKYPLAVFWIVLVATLRLDEAPVVLFFAVIIAAYTAAAYSPYRTAAIGSLVLAAVIVASTLRSTLPNIPNALVPFVILLPIAWLASSLRSWKQQAAASLARLRAVEEGQERATREAVELERARIARELHDVVTHNVSVMVVQAGAARKVMDAAPDQATQALLAVEASGRTAMAELRQVMGLLTSAADGAEWTRGSEGLSSVDGGGGAGGAGGVGGVGGVGVLSVAGGLSGAADGLGTDARFEPQPDLDRLESLVGRVREIGVPVTLTYSGTRRPLPPGVGLAGYRIVQEALTNTVKHAVGASAQVTVAYEEQRLRLEIADTGGVPGEAAASGNRRGLIGLRERLAVYGGSLETARRPTGGFRVVAIIPLEAQ